MIGVVEAKAKVIVDDSGIKSELPVLLTENGVLEPLLSYLLTHEHDRGPSWHKRVVQATRLLMEYMEANKHNFSDPKLLFQTFASRLYTGTVGSDGLDPSGLYWIPSSTNVANRHISALVGLTDWLADNQNVEHMNPLVTASSFDKRLNYASWYRRNQNDFLGHIKDKKINETVNRARNVQGRRSLTVVNDDAVAFKESLFERFYLKGFGAAQDRRCAVRDQLILIMMHGAGMRESDALHLWVTDVFIDPHNPDNAIVRIYHPEDGKAPENWRGRSGKTNRSAYLREQYALTPRNKLTGKQRVGWKGRTVDHKDNYIQLHWFPADFGLLFMRLWREHLLYLSATDRHHPYAFVSYSREHCGNPYTLNAFNENYRNALARIGLSFAKVEGLSSHSHRHAYARRLTRAGVDPILRKKALHHSSLESQAVYTAPGISDVTQAFVQASKRLSDCADRGGTALPFSDWESLAQTGFEDIDPLGLLSGPYPKLRSN